MSALLLKDFYVMWKQTRVLLILILVFSCLSGAFYPTFAVVYAAILPYTAMAYDERSKWGQMAAMLPYADREIVLSKYLFGYLAILVTAGISMVIQTALTRVWDQAADNLSPLDTIPLAMCAGHHAAADVPLRRGEGASDDVSADLPDLRRHRRHHRHHQRSFQRRLLSVFGPAGHGCGRSGADRRVHPPFPAVVP